MFWRRNGGRLESNGRHRVFHVIVDVVCVALAVVTGEFAFGVLGGCVWIHVFLKQWRGSPIGSSLGYLCLILLLTVRVPVAAADRVLQEMNECAVRMASWFLDQFHYLHVTTPDSIEVSGHSFPIHQIGDDVFSMPALVCLSCVFLCIMRRRWVHAVSSLAICSIIAVLMQAAKLYGTVVVWQNSVTGAAVSVGGLTLSATVFALALLSVISWDMLLSAFTEPVPLMATSTINPLAIFWNSFFLTHAEKQLDDDPDEVVPDVRSVLDEVPSVFPMLGPWTADFLFSWFITRSRRRILLGLPSTGTRRCRNRTVDECRFCCTDQWSVRCCSGRSGRSESRGGSGIGRTTIAAQRRRHICDSVSASSAPDFAGKQGRRDFSSENIDATRCPGIRPCPIMAGQAV